MFSLLCGAWSDMTSHNSMKSQPHAEVEHETMSLQDLHNKVLCYLTTVTDSFFESLANLRHL